MKKYNVIVYCFNQMGDGIAKSIKNNFSGVFIVDCNT